MELDHEEGFERERLYHSLLCWLRRLVPGAKASTLSRILRLIAPRFCAGLFEPRPCHRRLRYFGWKYFPDVSTTEDATDEVLRIGEVYESIDFNGATYTLKGYYDGKRRIGSAYFDRVG